MREKKRNDDDEWDEISITFEETLNNILDKNIRVWVKSTKRK